MKSEELFREIDEELQRERLLTLWHRYGTWIIGAALAIVVGVAAYLGWQRWETHSHQTQALEFAGAMQALADKHYPQAAQALGQLAAEASPGFSAMARLNQAKAQIEGGDRTAGLTTLAALAADPKVDPLFQSLAVLLGVSQEIDTADPAGLIQRLEPLAASGRPWRQPARILLAAAALRVNDTKQALKALEEIRQDATAPPETKRVAEQLMKAIGGDTPAAATP